MKKKSKLAIAKEIKDNGYIFECKGLACGTCKVFDFCLLDFCQKYNGSGKPIFDKEKVDAYIKRYDREDNGKKIKKRI